MKTAIVTDTNSGITAQMAREMGIYLIPMPFFIDGSTYYEGETCTPDFFFRHLKAKAEVSTSQPSPEVITSLWGSLLETHDAVLHFPMTAGLSGSCETAKALAQEFDGRVLVVDDHRISVTLAQSIRNALTLLAQGKTAQEVRGILEAEKDASSIYIAVNTLEYLKKSGRVTAAGAAMAAVLHFDVDAIVYTAGMAYEDFFCDDITAYVGKIAKVIRLPGEEEMRALAEGALRVLHGQQEAAQY